MTQPVTLKCRFLDTGYCLASEHHLIRGGKWCRREIHALVALLGHPTEGWFLWDTGYAPRFLDETRHFPYRIYRWVTPVRIRPELAVVAQLSRFGLEPKDIRQVILSHFHADHVAGLLDFPEAKIITSKAGYEDVASRKGFSALKRAFIPRLLPGDFEKRATLLDSSATDQSLLGNTVDLFGDGSALILTLPGHARGQIGLLVRTQRGPVLFAADSCWMSESYRSNTPPHWITNLFIDNATQMRATLGKLHHYWQEHPEVTIIPSHCPEAFATHVEGHS